MEAAEIREKSIVEYLSSLGIKPVREIGRSFVFYSPWRKEVEPSLHVFKNNGKFKDFGSGEAGNIIDFVMRLDNTDFKGAMKILKNGSAIHLPEFERPSKPLKKGVEVISANEIVSEDILTYTDTRCIPRHLIQKYCKQLSFRFPMGKRPGRIYTACGFPTNSGSFEIRSSFFKISTSPKSVSTFHGNPKRYAIYEGFMDFLSALTYFEKESFEETVIVLNSLAFISTLIPFLQDAESVNLYLDEGLPVEQKIVALTEANVPLRDCRGVFSPAQDFNEFLCSLNGHVHVTCTEK